MSGCCPVSPPPPQQDACPDQPPVGGRALGSRGERASAAGLCYLSLPKIPEAGFRAFPSESLKGPERVHRHSQACPGPKPWPAPLCVFPSAVGSQLGPTRPPPCSAELRSGPATTGGPMSREPRGGFSPPFLRFCPDSKIIAGTLRRGAVTGNLPELGVVCATALWSRGRPLLPCGPAPAHVAAQTEATVPGVPAQVRLRTEGHTAGVLTRTQSRRSPWSQGPAPAPTRARCARRGSRHLNVLPGAIGTDRCACGRGGHGRGRGWGPRRCMP